MIYGLVALFALALLAAPGQAQAPARLPAKAHLGEWEFKTQAYSGSCVLSGRMRILETSSGAMACRFDAVESCRGRMAKAQQTCTATRTRNTVTIKSKVVRTDSASYVPDDFEVELTSPDEMRGMMTSFNSAPVVFRRSAQAIS